MKKNWIAGIFFVLALFCGGLAVRGYVIEKTAGSSYEQVQEEARVEESKEPEAGEPEETPAEPEEEPEEEEEEELPVIPVDFESLKEDCPDIYAWIRIPGTRIDYPIVQSDEDTEDDFYLHHNVYKEYEFAGAIYTEKLNAKDFTDPNTVIYGHNMSNGSMFQNLHLFEDREFMEEHPYFEIFLPNKALTYRIFAAYNYDDRHLLKSIDFTDKEMFAAYLREILTQRAMSANIDYDAEVNEDCKIVTLSTCNGIDDQRYLVQGVLLSE